MINRALQMFAWLFATSLKSLKLNTNYINNVNIEMNILSFLGPKDEDLKKA